MFGGAVRVVDNIQFEEGKITQSSELELFKFISGIHVISDVDVVALSLQHGPFL